MVASLENSVIKPAEPHLRGLELGSGPADTAAEPQESQACCGDVEAHVCPAWQLLQLEGVKPV